MAVSKRLRYEVLKRDNHTCRYCGASAPTVALTVDHVMPVALGGTDLADNLITACVDCNSGKSSTSPDAQTVAEVGEADMRWAEAVRRAAERAVAEAEGRGDRHAWFVAEWSKWKCGADGADGESVPLPTGWAKSLDHWLGAGLPKPIILECLDIAMNKRGVKARYTFAYMGGVARKKLEEIHEVAKSLLDEGIADDGP